MENDSKPLASALDPKRFPEIERFRINYAPRVGGPFAVDRLYAEIQELYDTLEIARQDAIDSADRAVCGDNEEDELG